jgi:hypothetical protein
VVVAQTAWPDRAQYAQFVQAPAHHLRDPELATAVFARSRLGTPKVWSGGRAVVFQAETPSGRKLAVRFLLAEDDGHRRRYDALGLHLADHPLPCLVPTQWVEGGLVVDGRALPLIKMDWVDGVPLDEHVEGLVGRHGCQTALLRLAEHWRHQSQALVAAGIAHGDIHAQNVLVRDDDRPDSSRIRLVDYDCVWLPSLSGLGAGEVGHPNFRHPGRTAASWGAAIDAFPNLLMYLSLRAIAADPSLWHFHQADAALLFEAADLERSRDRGLWSALASNPDPSVRAVTLLLHQWLVDHPERYRTLEDALDRAGGLPAERRPEPTAPPVAPNRWPGRDRPPVEANLRPNTQQTWHRASAPPAGPRLAADRRRATRPTAQARSAASGKGNGAAAVVIAIIVVVAIAVAVGLAAVLGSGG